LKILVSIKRVTDPDARIKLRPDKSGIDAAAVEYKVNPFDENAVEEALRLSEKHGNAEVVLVTLGPEEVTHNLRQALAMGAHRAIRVEAKDEALDSDLAARALAAVFKRESPDLFILGKQAIDGDNNQVGQLVAEYLGVPQACFASKVLLEGDEAIVTREVDGGLETVALKRPCVITSDLRLNEPRYASLPGIMKAKTKRVDVVSLADLGITDIRLKVEVVGLAEPPGRKAGVMVGSVDELLGKLKNEARVI
jgi:electron transfer flavoprotein beta subunit